LEDLIQKDTWLGNYWDAWKVIGSQKKLGKLILGRYTLDYP